MTNHVFSRLLLADIHGVYEVGLSLLTQRVIEMTSARAAKTENKPQAKFDFCSLLLSSDMQGNINKKIIVNVKINFTFTIIFILH